MPGGAGRPKRACRMCKHYKYVGNGKERRKPSERRKLQDDGRRRR